GASTTSNYVSVTGNPATPTPLDGDYAITNNIPSNAAWFAGSPDHTSADGKGYMAFYNSSEQPGEFYSQRIDNLCGETTYQFAAWIANAVNPAVLAGVQPNITFRIEQTDGVLLGSYNTGPIAETAVFTWNQYGFFFTTPGNVSSVVLKIINNSPGGTVTMGNDLAIDDITFRACGPLSSASFNAFGSTLTQTVCEDSWAMLYGTVSAGYLHPVNLWQTSTDNGLTWSDVPNSASLQLKVTVPVTGTAKTYLYRMLTAEQDNIQSPSCRVLSNEISLISDAGPVLQITHDTSICAGSSLTLAVSGGNNYTWSPAAYLDNPGTANPVATPVTETRFLVTATDLQLCERMDSVTLSIRPDVIFKAPADAALCVGNSVTLKGDNDPSFSYSWSPAGSLDNPSVANPVASPAVTTQYIMHVQDPICLATADFPLTVKVNTLPVVTAARSNDIDCLNGISQLLATGGAAYSWSPAEGLSDAAISNPVAAIDSTTTFMVNAIDSNGCAGSAFVKVVVTDHGKALLVLPNAFTPNYDGVNDCFGIRRWGNVTIKEFSVYNRWGQKVFDTRNPSECWDGTFNGQMQGAGGYVYVIKAVSFCGNITRTGTVMLIR
ncbi:MAG: gliding motility-associated C-terminal domain-containing protein, partial [Bacteroidota bacterium]|nr:gliding motility-associated C-terminal domain-containing protein [Bacteroidota bacterium]